MLTDAYVSSLERQVSRVAAQADSAPISLYFGGGTPSLAPPSFVQTIISWVQNRFPTADMEVTLEANPTVLATPQ